MKALLLTFVVFVTVGCGGRTECIMRCAGRCNGSPTHGCQEACQDENGCPSREIETTSESYVCAAPPVPR